MRDFKYVPIATGNQRQGYSWCRATYGGTLIEVLVSLVILCLLLTSVLDGMRQVRTAREFARRSDWASAMIAQWKLARLQRIPWAQGDSGTFETPDVLETSPHASWRLDGLIASSSHPNSPDSLWRTLLLYAPEDQVTPVWRSIVRLDPPLIAPDPAPDSPKAVARL